MGVMLGGSVQVKSKSKKNIKKSIKGKSGA